ncbi:MAG: hypothetical protein ACOYXC_08940 [Candidatus Rifleibacteriota bacterium]
MAELEKQIPSAMGKTYLKIFMVVVTLAAVFLISAILAANSQGFSRFAIGQLAMNLEKQGYKVEIASVTGNLYEGLDIPKVTLRRASPAFLLSAENLKLKFDFSALLAASGISAELELEKLSLNGAPGPIWLKNLPGFPEVGCIANIPGNFKLNHVLIHEAEIRPFNDDQLWFKLNQLNLEPSQKGQQPLNLSFEGYLRDRRFFDGKFAANFSQKAQKIEGRLEGCLAGRNLSTEIVGAVKGGKFELSGYFAEAAIDLGILSRWLISLWQTSFPFGFDGIITLGGSWVYSEKTGFIGNISGDFNKIHMVAQGLFLTIFELNGHWKFFDDTLEVSDSGSLFAGFPAVINGRIEQVFALNRRWDLNFAADHIDTHKFYNDLPWGVKYGSGIPAMKGPASFSLQIKGNVPAVSASIVAENLEISTNSSTHQLAGQIFFNSEDLRKSLWRIKLKHKFAGGRLPLFHRFGRQDSKFDLVVSGAGECQWDCSGHDLANFAVQGKLIQGETINAELNGNFTDGSASIFSISEDSALNGYKSEKMTFLQFLLGF